MPDLSDERRWRVGLEVAGRAAVEEYLRLYPGGPDDEMWDLPLEPPFPSRAFCQEWLLGNSRTVTAYRGLIVFFALTVLIGVSYAGCRLGQLAGPTAPQVAAPPPGPTVPPAPTTSVPSGT